MGDHLFNVLHENQEGFINEINHEPNDGGINEGISHGVGSGD